MNKELLKRLTFLATFGITGTLVYTTYKLFQSFKELDNLDWENIGDAFYFRTPDDLE